MEKSKKTRGRGIGKPEGTIGRGKLTSVSLLHNNHESHRGSMYTYRAKFLISACALNGTSELVGPGASALYNPIFALETSNSQLLSFLRQSTKRPANLY